MTRFILFKGDEKPLPLSGIIVNKGALQFDPTKSYPLMAADMQSVIGEVKNLESNDETGDIDGEVTTALLNDIEIKEGEVKMTVHKVKRSAEEISRIEAGEIAGFVYVPSDIRVPSTPSAPNPESTNS